MATAVTHDNQGRKAESAATLDNLGNTTDMYNTVNKIQFRWIYSTQ
jgi:hypothetical protein